MTNDKKLARLARRLVKEPFKRGLTPNEFLGWITTGGGMKIIRKIAVIVDDE